MRKLTNEEIATVEERTVITKIEIDGFTDVRKPYQILVKRCKFTPDSAHKDESSLFTGHSLCYKITLISVETNVEEDVRFFTQCTESEMFIHVGNYMGTVYMMNTFADEYYLRSVSAIN